MRARSAVFSLILLLAACGTDAPLAPPDPTPASVAPRFAQVPVVAGIICVGFRSAMRLDCGVSNTFGVSKSIVVNSPGSLIRVEPQSVSYDAVRGEFTFDMRAGNRAQRSAIGTFDGVTADSRGINLVLVSEPQVIDGVGAVKPLDARVGTLASYLPRNKTYYRYPEVVQPGRFTQWQRWRFSVPKTVNRFRFEVAVFTEVQPEVRISEVMPGLLDNAGRLVMGAYYEVANVGQFDINDDVPGGGIWVLQDSAYNGKVAAAHLYVHGPWKPGERRLVAEARWPNFLNVPLDGAFVAGYWPALQWGHALKVRSGGGLLLDRVTMALPQSRYNGYSFQKRNLQAPNHTIPDIQEWVSAQTRIHCMRPCQPLWGTPRAAGW